jgi:hypothetical protein
MKLSTPNSIETKQQAHQPAVGPEAMTVMEKLTQLAIEDASETLVNLRRLQSLLAQGR